METFEEEIEMFFYHLVLLTTSKGEFEKGLSKRSLTCRSVCDSCVTVLLGKGKRVYVGDILWHIMW